VLLIYPLGPRVAGPWERGMAGGRGCAWAAERGLGGAGRGEWEGLWAAPARCAGEKGAQVFSFFPIFFLS
jgi:hypothetical protein